MAWLDRISARMILWVGALGTLAYGYPGYLNYDSNNQLEQARTGLYDDWHPPFMARYWRVSDQIVHGPFPLFILQTAMFLWGLSGILKIRFSPRVSAIGAVALMWFPPVLVVMGAVWKDSQMAAWLIYGTMLMLRPSARARTGGAVLLVIGCAVRDNAMTALPPLILLIVAYAAVRGFWKIVGTGIVLFALIAGGGIWLNKHYTDGRAHAWWRANAIHDIAGTMCFAPPLSDEQAKVLLAGIPLRKSEDIQAWMCRQYMPRWWFPLSFGENPLFAVVPDQDDMDARSAAYIRLIERYPAAFARHRWNVTRELLGFGEIVPDEPVIQSFAGTPDQALLDRTEGSLSKVQRVLGRRFLRMAQPAKLWFRPWAYLAIGLCMLGYAIVKRDGLVAALVGSGILYEVSYVLGAAGAPYRYSHWMITMCCLATLVVFGQRYRAGRSPRPVGA